MNWNIKAFDDLTAAELYDIMVLRAEVFVVEQECAYQDPDGDDPKAIHLWAANEQGQTLAYCRIFPPNIKCPEVSIGRVVSSPSVRRTGLGRECFRRSVDYADSLWPQVDQFIHAQTYLVPFYSSFGYEVVGEPFLEDGLPHRYMKRVKN